MKVQLEGALLFSSGLQDVLVSSSKGSICGDDEVASEGLVCPRRTTRAERTRQCIYEYENWCCRLGGAGFSLYTAYPLYFTTMEYLQSASAPSCVVIYHAVILLSGLAVLV